MKEDSKINKMLFIPLKILILAKVMVSVYCVSMQFSEQFTKKLLFSNFSPLQSSPHEVNMIGSFLNLAGILWSNITR